MSSTAGDASVTPVNWDDLGKRVQAEIEGRFLPHCSPEEESLVTKHLLPSVKFTPYTMWPSTHSLPRVRNADKCPPELRWGLTCFVFGIKKTLNLSKFKQYRENNPNALDKFQLGDEPCIPLPNGVSPIKTGVKRKVAKAQTGGDGDGDGDNDDGGESDENRPRAKTGLKRYKLSNRADRPETEARDRGVGLDRPETDVKDRDRDLDSPEATLKDRESALGSREAVVKDRESALDSHEAELNDRESALDRREAELKDREATMKSREIELEGREADLSTREHELGDHTAALDSLEAELQNREAELDQLKTSLDSSEDDLEKREADLSHRQSTSRAGKPPLESECKQEHDNGDADTQAQAGRRFNKNDSAQYQRCHDRAILSTNAARVLFDMAVSDVADAKDRENLIAQYKESAECLIDAINLCLRISRQWN